MKAISLHQPWAQLVALGQKEYETRSWSTRFRGKIAIHAAKFQSREWAKLTQSEPFVSTLFRANYRTYGTLPFGAVVAVADLVAVYHADELAEKLEAMSRTNELAFGDFGEGRYAWRLANVRMITPIPCRGYQGIWNWDREI